MLRIRKFDLSLFFCAILLLALGTIGIVSVSLVNLSSHLLYVFIALIFFALFSLIDLEIFFALSPITYLLSVVFLTLPFLLGTITRGSIRWIPIGQFTIQPSELVKPFLAIAASWYWTKKELNLKSLGIFCLLALPVIFLIFLQPDLGSTLSVLSILFGILLMLKMKTRQVLIVTLMIILLIPAFWFSLKDYQRHRVINFLNPYADPLGKGYNIIQAKITVGSGGLWGRGFGRGTQSHLAFLPERHTDFIFSSLAEEIGFAGVIFVCLLYFLLLLRIINIAFISLTNSANFPFFLLSIGLFFYFSFQIIVNIGMNMGLLPITGITLPLLSYGGSSLLTSMISLGILESIYNHSQRERTLEIG